ncbi:hypothetical protein G7Y89_g14852 [Cudoniella acicularis]|uniref:Uncharacterized protein n=1 Tax=Cudoniella acicularis TaxID=354080 RepID=A0A8H4QWU1_9HELO|nr:hypothetical protein G7Y89_g14852 [Cudoniella acicularis]
MSSGDGNNAALATGLLADLKAIGFKGAPSDIHTLIELLKSVGKPTDDRELVNILYPKLGAAGTPHAKTIRSGKKLQGKGLLKPDTFHEARLLGQLPGVNVMLVMYSRYHNYVADMLLKINEGGRFTLRPHKTDTEKAAAVKKQDEDLFQTARLNQISCEFNLMYRFHSVISKKDEKWMEDFFHSVFPRLDKLLDQLSPIKLWQGLARWEASVPTKPSKREFGGIKRGADGKFSDADLVKIFKESTKDPAGSFGARTTPKALRIIEIMGILQARKWQVASLNEFRDFFGLKAHKTMEEINPGPEIADLLRKLYNHPDMVELFPGLFIEDTNPAMAPGHGGCINYTLGRAIFSDAVTLVRSDRFNTIDYTPATLTNWSFEGARQDYKTLGGSMFYKLVQRALPGWFPFNSLHIMQPMYTRKMNEQIVKELGTISLFSKADPALPAPPVFVPNNAIVQKIFKDQLNFIMPIRYLLNELFPSKRDFSNYMLSGDAAVNTTQRNLTFGNECLTVDSLNMARDLDQIDILRDQLHNALAAVRQWQFAGSDLATMWNARRKAQDGATILTESTNILVKDVLRGSYHMFWAESLYRWMPYVGTKTRRDLSRHGSLGCSLKSPILPPERKPSTLGNTKDLAEVNTPEADKTVREYVLEA